jgi:hypothetical protein
LIFALAALIGSICLVHGISWDMVFCLSSFGGLVSCRECL